MFLEKLIFISNDFGMSATGQPAGRSVIDRDKGPDEHGDRRGPGPGPGGGSADFGMALIHIGRIMMRS